MMKSTSRCVALTFCPSRERRGKAIRGARRNRSGCPNEPLKRTGDRLWSLMLSNRSQQLQSGKEALVAVTQQQISRNIHPVDDVGKQK